ncbi:MAG: hypothetical protein KBF88_12530 [Polyangiaceae bacterium]|nr:hypothetical protein [Polyangiaceae bacterium]
MMTEPSFFDAFKQNPVSFLAIFLFCIAALVLAIVSLMKKKRWIALLSIAFVLTAYGFGVYATILHRGFATAVSEGQGLSSADRTRLMDLHLSESWYPIETAAFGGVLPLLLGLIGLALANRATAKAQKAGSESRAKSEGAPDGEKRA